jgi:hypothetical protein
MKTKERILDRKIISIASVITALAPAAVMAYAPEVKAIIAERCRDGQRIERTLDWMLDFCWDNKMLELCRKLCRYYYRINPSATAKYVYAYRDMWDQGESRSTVLKKNGLIGKKTKRN